MKIVTIMGSPNLQGNTAKTLECLESLLAANGHETVRINAVERNIAGCQGCYACQQPSDEPICVLKDDAQDVFSAIMAADTVVFATPLYCWDFPAQIKPLLDRHLCMVKSFGGPDHKSFVDGKRAALLVTCGGPVENNADLIQEIFDRMVGGYLKNKIVGKYVIPFSGASGSINPATSMETAQKMFQDITTP